MAELEQQRAGRAARGRRRQRAAGRRRASTAIKGPQFTTTKWQPRRPEARVKRRRRIPSHGAGPLEQEVFTYLAHDESLRRHQRQIAAGRPALKKQVRVNGAKTWQPGSTKAKPVFHGGASRRGPPQAVPSTPTASRPSSAAWRPALKQVTVNGTRTWQSGIAKAKPVFHGGASRHSPPQAASNPPTLKWSRTPLARNIGKAEKARFKKGSPAPLAPKHPYVVRKPTKMAHTDALGRPLADAALDMVDRMVTSSRSKIRSRGRCGRRTPTTSSRCACS